jgi:hypothetical protein
VRLLALLTAAALAAAAGAADIYRWVDADGKVHFGEVPPTDVKAEKLAIRSAPTDKGAVEMADLTRQVRENQAAADAVVASNAAKEAAAKAAQKAEECEAARKRLEAVQHSRKFATTGADGKETWVSGGEAVDLKAKLQAEVEAKCGG